MVNVEDGNILITVLLRIKIMYGRMKRRVNIGKIIEELEYLRQGFDSWRNSATNPVDKVSANAYHKLADKLIKELGGESVREN